MDDEFAELHRNYLLGLFERLTFRERAHRVLEGLKAPRESGEHKWARLQIQRLCAPAAGIIVPVLVCGLLVMLAAFAPEQMRTHTVEIVEPEKEERLEEVDEQQLEQTDVMPEELNMTVSDLDVNVRMPDPTPVPDFSPKPAPIDSVAIVKSPIVMKGIYGNRDPGARGRAMGRYGGSKAGEDCVLRALRWLKKYQESDGSWNLRSGGGVGVCKHTKIRDGAPVGITGLGLLTFLAHGETPASNEFGKTVEYAIKYLIGAQEGDGMFKSKDGRKNYSHPIAVYALSEAYSMTRIPAVREAAEKAMQAIIRGQHADGTFDYSFAQSTRNDVTYASWCAQALKAGKMARLENEGIEEAIKRGIQGFKTNYSRKGNGSFYYTTRSQKYFELTSAAVLCMQLLGGAREQEARQGVAWLRKNMTCNWESPPGECPIYYWYYTTQAMFHEGGEAWREWNRQFSQSLVGSQTIVVDAIAAPDGTMKDIGYWKPAKESEWAQSFAYNTTLCTLQLEVYYRYLPTYQAPQEEELEDGTAGQDEDIEIEVNL